MATAEKMYELLSEQNKQLVSEKIYELLKGEMGGKKVAREYLTDAQVEKEIERLKKSEYVKLAKKEERIRLRRRQYMYCLRGYEKKGKELAAAGITMEMLDCLNDEEMEA